MKQYTSKLDSLLENTGDMALKRRAREIILALDPQPGDKILEVGCGDGYYLHLLQNLGIKNLTLSGVDIDAAALESARKNLRSKKISLQVADLMKKLPFKANSFNKIVMSEVAEHLPNDVKGMKEVARVLKARGTYIVTVPNARYPILWDPLNKILETFFGTHIKSGFFAGLWNMHIRLYKEEDIVAAVRKAGFKVIEHKSLTYWCLPFNHYIVNLTARAIHSGKLDPKMKAALNKYEVKAKRPAFIDFAFKAVNVIDKLNDIAPVKKRGVGAFVLATK